MKTFQYPYPQNEYFGCHSHSVAGTLEGRSPPRAGAVAAHKSPSRKSILASSPQTSAAAAHKSPSLKSLQPHRSGEVEGRTGLGERQGAPFSYWISPVPQATCGRRGQGTYSGWSRRRARIRPAARGRATPGAPGNRDGSGRYPKRPRLGCKTSRPY